MVTKITKSGKLFFQCDECLMTYRKEADAEDCKNWCSNKKDNQSILPK